MCLGEIIAELTCRIREFPGNQIMMQRFIHFVHDVCQWNLNQIEKPLVERFTRLILDAYLGFTPEEFRLFAMHQPERAEAIVQFLLSEGA